jgi:hypothetical protein
MFLSSDEYLRINSIHLSEFIMYRSGGKRFDFCCRVLPTLGNYSRGLCCHGKQSLVVDSHIRNETFGWELTQITEPLKFILLFYLLI